MASITSPSQKSTKSLLDNSLTESHEEEISLDIEWIPHSTPVALSYFAISISSILYYASCFIYEYGKYSHRVIHDWLAEPFLIRVVLIQWTVIAILLFSGIMFYRRIFMPLYIFLAVIATNGTIVLFVIKCKQLIDERIDLLDISFNLITLLFVVSILHNLLYFYAIHADLINKRRYRKCLRV